MSEVESFSQIIVYPVPTGKKAPDNELPENPNYPWGGDSPLHRHRNVTELGDGLDAGAKRIRSSWSSRLGRIVDKVKRVWKRRGEGGEETANDDD